MLAIYYLSLQKDSGRDTNLKKRPSDKTKMTKTNDRTRGEKEWQKKRDVLNTSKPKMQRV